MDRPQRRTVLVVDDNDDVRDVYATVLASEGYRVEVARDGEEALAVLAREADVIDVVLLDLMMPKLDGVELLRRKSRDARCARIPVVVTSATGTLAHLPAAAGVRQLLVKPVDMFDLLRAVEAATQGRPPAGRSTSPRTRGSPRAPGRP